MIQSISEIYLRNFNSLHTEITGYHREEDLWIIDNQILNSAGNLTLHLVGNINYFIGAVLGQTGYIRDRDKEFSDKHIPKLQLLNAVESASQTVQTTLSAMDDAAAVEIYPIDKFGEGRTNGYVLMYLLAHFNYHLGQINYHRRLLIK